SAFTSRIRAMGIRDRPISPRSPWQNPYVERLIGTLRRECLDHVLIFGERRIRPIIMRRAPIWDWPRTRRYDEPSNHLGPSSSHQFCQDCIIATRGCNFQEGQVGARTTRPCDKNDAAESAARNFFAAVFE